MKQKILKFPQGFLWGVSTSAYQVEGGIKCDWSEWEKSEARIRRLKQAGKNIDDYICGSACDSYNRYDEDLALVKELNCNAYRFGLEWARIEPAEGKFDRAEIEHYKKILQAAKAKNLKVVLTLWHWTSPCWLGSSGWTDRDTVDKFTRYVSLAAKEFGDYVDFWITLNEPMAYLGFGYIRGNFPPGKVAAVFSAARVYKNLVKAHIAAYKKIHEVFPSAQVSFTSLTDFFEPASRYNPLDWLIVTIARYFHHRKYLNDIRNYLDFIAFDYYFHQRLSWLPPFRANLNRDLNDMGWEIYPAGIYHVIKYLAGFNKPIYVMENGIADAKDKKRAKFIISHLRYVHQAISQGIDVRGYFHWSLLDNYEWAHGFAPRFGLYHVDRKTFKRTARPSAKVYAEICQKNQLIIDN